MHLMSFEVVDEDKQIIEEVARERRGMTVADFIRSCIYRELVSSRGQADRAAAQKLSGHFRHHSAINE